MITTFNNIAKVNGVSGDAGQAHGVDLNNLFHIVDSVISDTSTSDMASAMQLYANRYTISGTANNIVISGKALPQLDHDFDLHITPVFNNTGAVTITLDGVSKPLVDIAGADVVLGSLINKNEVKIRYSNANDKFTLHKLEYSSTTGTSVGTASGAIVNNKTILNTSLNRVVTDSDTNANTVIVISTITPTTMLELTVVDKLLGDIYKIQVNNNDVMITSNYTSTGTVANINEVACYLDNGTLSILKKDQVTKFGKAVVIINTFITSDNNYTNLSIAFGNVLGSPNSTKVDTKEYVTDISSISYEYKSFLPKVIVSNDLDTSLSSPLLKVNATLDGSNALDYIVFNTRVGGSISQYAIDALEPYKHFHRKTTNATLAGVSWTSKSILDVNLKTNIIGSSSGNSAYNTTKKLYDLINAIPSAGGHPLNGGAAQSLLVPSIPLAQNDTASIGYAIDTYLPIAYTGSNISVLYLHGTKLDERVLNTTYSASNANATYKRKHGTITGAEAPTAGVTYFASSYFLDDYNGFQTANELKAVNATTKQKMYIRWFTGDGVNPVVFDPWLPMNKYDTYSSSVIDQQYTLSNGRLKSNMSDGTTTLIFEETINERELQLPMIKAKPLTDRGFYTVNNIPIGANDTNPAGIAFNAGYTSLDMSIYGAGDSKFTNLGNTYALSVTNMYYTRFLDLDNNKLITTDNGALTNEYLANSQSLGSPYSLTAMGQSVNEGYVASFNDTLYATATRAFGGTSSSVTNYSVTKKMTPSSGTKAKYTFGLIHSGISQSDTLSAYGMYHNYDTFIPGGLAGKRLTRHQYAGGIHITQVCDSLGNRLASGRRPWAPYYAYLGGVANTNGVFTLEVNSTHVSRSTYGGLLYYGSDNKHYYVGNGRVQDFYTLSVNSGPTLVETLMGFGRIQSILSHFVGTVTYAGKQWHRKGRTAFGAFGGSTSSAFVLDTTFTKYCKEHNKALVTDIDVIKFCSV